MAKLRVEFDCCAIGQQDDLQGFLRAKAEYGWALLWIEYIANTRMVYFHRPMRKARK